MIILIAESKTMNTSLEKIPNDEFHKHRPMFEKEAQEIMGFIRSNSVQELALRLKVSQTIASKSWKFAYNFTDETFGKKALDEYTGEVFKALNVKTLGRDEIRFTDNHLLIVSSIYGLLKPDDIIRPYRLEFSCDCGPSGEKINDFWKKRNTIALAKHLKEKKETEILNLLPGDAIKCFDFKLLKHFARVMKPDFKVLSDTDELKTPHAGKLKELRGLLLRHIITQHMDTLDDILSISDFQFGLYHEKSKQDYPLFICDSQ